MKRSKKYLVAMEKINPKQQYEPAEAVKLAKETASIKFDPTVEAHFRLGIDPKQSDQQLRSTISLPHGTGKDVKVLAIVGDDKAKEAKAAGADKVGGTEVIDEIAKSKKCNYDVVVTTPEMMKDLAKIAKVLGPKGLMPNPKTETVTPNPGKVIEEFKKGKLSFKNDETGNIHVPIGKASMDEKKLVENFQAFYDNLLKLKPASTKGVYIKNISISTTMGPGIKVKM